MNAFRHVGDLGDIVASFPSIRELGGGKLIISDAQSPIERPRESLRGKRFEALQPLSEATTFISSIEWHDNPTHITHDIAPFRYMHRKPAENLAVWQGRFLGLTLPTAPEPWLHVDVPQNGRIVISRTNRYHSIYFPWQSIVDHYGEELLFLGLPEEHKEFQSRCHRHIDYAPTDSLLEATKIIAGSKMYIGSQSILCWIAIGLGHPLIQETTQIQDRTAIVPRDNAVYTGTTEGLEKLYEILPLCIY